MGVKTQSCVLFLWMYTMTLVKTQAVVCKLPPTSLEGTQYEPAFTNVFLPGATVTVTCGNKYWIDNKQVKSAVITCNEDGEWNLRPVCEEVTCSNQRPQHVNYWGIPWHGKITLDETVPYSCVKGYEKPHGVDLATCTREGWSPNPLCQAPPGCGSPPFLSNGQTTDTILDHYEQNARVQYTCSAYHTMEGDPFKTCIDGQWIGEMKCLRPCTTDEEAMRSHNIQFKYGRDNKLYSPHLEWIEFACTDRRKKRVGTVGMRQQCVDGEMQLPTCL